MGIPAVICALYPPRWPRSGPWARIAAGQTVLIHAAAGGTGQTAVKMARHYGAAVIATATPGKHETVRALGAEHVLDSRRPRSRRRGTAADRRHRRRSGSGVSRWRHTRRRPDRGQTGHRLVIVYGMAGGAAPVTNLGADLPAPSPRDRPDIGVLIQAAPQMFSEVMGELSALIAAGVLTPGEATIYDLADGPKALAGLETRRQASPAALTFARSHR
jgi:NADPH:quinone reductase